jgi:DNA polymerase-3 subunit gamma/tau
MSNFIVSARKYRPQRFEDVVGQQHVAGTLKNALATDHLAHAFLFTGPRGVGKTTCARILAKVLNCENLGKNYEACNECPSCTAFNDDASWNIFELDAASNNGVDHIRALVDQVRVPPQRGKFKVYIIDEVHMLSAGAFNAFLKTLEEPPPYAVFILATTEKHKIIPTILSRCQVFDFRRITPADMVLHLKHICTMEGIEAEADALHIIAQKADGALRDALSIFDRITSYSGKKITYTDVIEHLNVLDYDYYFQITDALLAEDVPAVLNLFDQILRKGFEPDIFIIGLAEHLRNILVCKDEATLALLETGDSLRERYRKQAALAPASFLLTALNLANDCDIHFKMARYKRLHVEMSIIKMGYINRAVKAAQPVFVEKKTPDVRNTQSAAGPGHSGADDPKAPHVESDIPGSAGQSQSNPPNIPQNENSRSLGISPQPSTTSNAQPLSRDQMSALAAELQMGVKKADKISLKLESFEAAVDVDDAKRASLESRLNLENAAAEWKKYADAHDSNLVRIAMVGAQLSLQDKMMTARVKSTMDRSHIQGELMRILDSMRHGLHDPALKVLLEIDDSIVPDQKLQGPKRPLSNKDKLEVMRENNPVIGDFIQIFDLKLDE